MAEPQPTPVWVLTAHPQAGGIVLTGLTVRASVTEAATATKVTRAGYLDCSVAMGV